MAAAPITALPVVHENAPDIIDIRSDTDQLSLKEDILKGLHPENGDPKTLPTLLLYDELGLRLFEKITYLDEYYLTGQEILVLEKYADRIAERIPDGAIIVELGSGALRKVAILLDALERAKKNVTYFALDLMYAELVRTLAVIPKGRFQYVKCAGLWGTYDDGLEWLRQPENTAKPKAILSIGSSLGNFTPEEAVPFIAQFVAELGSDDFMLIGLDGCQDPEKVYHAYNDFGDVTHNFTMNGLKHANKILGREAFKESEWEAVGEYDERGSRHRAFVVPKTDLTVEGAFVKKGEKIQIEESNKYPLHEAEKLWREVGEVDAEKEAKAGASWTSSSTFYGNEDGSYFLYLLGPSKMLSSSKPEEYAAHPVPSLHEWDELWGNWDTITRQMISHDELYEKPIKLRNDCIFYLGHVPTFFDIKITEATKGKPTEPSYFYKIFERGIDPDVDNPEKVHAHSEVPDTWPALDEILTFQQKVRERVVNLYKSGKAYNDNWVGRALWLGFEHEVMHMETLLYMLVQSEKTLPPAGTMKPDFEQLAAQTKREAVNNEWFDIPEQTFQVGLDDPETADGPVRYYGWDVEKPAYQTKAKAFKAKGRPITNGEYAEYLKATGKKQIPASWEEVHVANNVNDVKGPNGHHTNGINGNHTSGHHINGINGHHTNGINGHHANGINGHHTDGINGHHINGDSLSHDFLEGKAIRTVYGPVPLKHALDWPVAASYDELAGCAQYMGGRIPTADEVRSIYVHVERLKQKGPSKALGRTIPAVNSHLVNEGVEETPPHKHCVNGSSTAAAGLDPKQYFVNLEQANVGFKHWHPMPVVQNGGKLAGLGEMGGLWEWTSSVLERMKGFEPMKMYPAYSADFFDEKHNIVFGGSWATHPRIAGRKTFVNWYQRNYPFVWAGARLVKDV